MARRVKEVRRKSRVLKYALMAGGEVRIWTGRRAVAWGVVSVLYRSLVFSFSQ